MKIKVLFKKIWLFMVNLWKRVDETVEKFAPIAINVVNVLKNVNEGTSGDIIEMVLSKIIPGKADDAFIALARERLRKILPKVLMQLNIANSIAQISDPNEQLKAILASINMSSDETKNAYYHSLCALILQSLSDGKLTWSESVQIAEYYYVHIYKKE